MSRNPVTTQHPDLFRSTRSTDKKHFRYDQRKNVTANKTTADFANQSAQQMHLHAERAAQRHDEWR
jgi:hypothetical protein